MEQETAESEPLLLTKMKEAADTQYRKIVVVPVDFPTEIGAARERLESARSELQRLQHQETDAAARIDILNQNAAQIQAELPLSSAEYNAQKIPVCPICKVALDETLVAGCNLSTVSCDLENLRLSIETKTNELASHRQAAQALRERQQPLKGEIALAQQVFERTKSAVDRLERVLTERTDEIRTAERAADAVRRQESLAAERDRVAEALVGAEETLGHLKDEIIAHRSTQAAVFRDLSSKFDGILRELIPGDVSGHVSVDGIGLHLAVEMNGERSTAALDSWKVVAFDLAALAMTIEGSTHLPSMLLHDSPREADLGFSLYERLFWFIRKLESYGPDPLFQYIITTTTEPPSEFQTEPCLRLLLRGAPASERFLSVDL